MRVLNRWMTEEDRERWPVRLLACLLLAMSLTGAVAWQELSYPFGDDYLYRLLPPQDVERLGGDLTWMERASEIGSAGELLESIKINYRAYNGRLSNFLFMPLGLGPLWLDKAVGGTIVFLMLVGLIWVGLPRERRLKPWYVALGTVLFWTVFPWQEHMQSSDFVFNYPLAAVVVLGFMMLYRRMDSFGRAGKAGMLVLAFVAGWIHEAFALSLGAYVLTTTILEAPRNAWRWGLLAAGAAGLAVIYCSFIGTRLAEGGDFSWTAWKREGMYFFGVLATLVLAVLLVWLMRRRLKPEAWRGERGEMLGLLAGALIGFVICYRLGLFRRERWAMDVFVVLIYLRFSWICLPDMLRARRRTLWWVSAAFALCYGLWLTGMLGIQKEVGDTRRTLEAKLQPRYSRTVGVEYGPLISRDDVPWYYMGIPNPVYDNHYHMGMIANYLAGDDAFSFLPDEFRGKSFEELPAVPGNAGVRGVQPYFIIKSRPRTAFRVEGDEANFTDSPGPWVVSKVKGALREDENVIYPWSWLYRMKLNDSSEVYRLYFELPYTFQRRKIERIDTVAE